MTLQRRRDATLPGTYDIRWSDGLAVVGEVTATTGTDTDGTVTRRVESVVQGDLRPGLRVLWGQNVLTGDPKTALGLEFTEVDVPWPLGEYPA